MDGLHMRRLFVLDSKDYDDTHSVTVKNTVRAIICRDGRYAMQQNRDGIYKIPGGGVENNESLLDTLCRETLGNRTCCYKGFCQGNRGCAGAAP